MGTLKHDLRIARPSLKSVSPMSYWFIMLMGVFNLIIGVAFVYTLGNTQDSTLLTVSKILPFWVWGILFFILGVVKLVSIFRNSWKWARRTLLTGVGLKSVWAIALIVKSLNQPDNIFLTLTWVTIACTQIICYIYFLPPQEMRQFSGKAIERNGQ